MCVAESVQLRAAHTRFFTLAVVVVLFAVIGAVYLTTVRANIQNTKATPLNNGSTQQPATP